MTAARRSIALGERLRYNFTSGAAFMIRQWRG
jgi:hypothetical protein